MLNTDPRPDLPEDSRHWAKVLPKALEVNRTAAEVLHGLRCLGATLQPMAAGYRLSPGIGPGYYYANADEWKRDRERYLVPLQSDLQRILSR